jgi:2-amino-4-hydroxy-6-hydroxymethyldihydropteridine diphosphokinase
MLAGALRLLRAPDLRVARISPVYETEPQDVKDQPWFLNLVAEIETDLFPRQLLARIQKIEKQLGRKRGAPKGPRTIDIDILLFGSSVIGAPDLVVPHPRMAERRFVLQPLSDLAPDLRHPLIKRTMRELLGGVSGQAAVCKHRGPSLGAGRSFDGSLDGSAPAEPWEQE